MVSSSSLGLGVDMSRHKSQHLQQNHRTGKVKGLSREYRDGQASKLPGAKLQRLECQLPRKLSDTGSLRSCFLSESKSSWVCQLYTGVELGCHFCRAWPGCGTRWNYEACTGWESRGHCSCERWRSEGWAWKCRVYPGDWKSTRHEGDSLSSFDVAQNFISNLVRRMCKSIWCPEEHLHLQTYLNIKSQLTFARSKVFVVDSNGYTMQSCKSTLRILTQRNNIFIFNK